MKSAPESVRRTPSLGSPALVLFPTEIERRRFEDQGGLPIGAALAELCGFGPVAAASRAAQLVAELKPSRVFLVGIAGTFDPDGLAVGEAYEFGAVAIDGVGVGEGASLATPPALGFPQWPGSTASGVAPIFDRIPLAVPAGARHAGLLLTTCAASADAAQASVRRERFPDAAAEDMEGFAVATACAMAAVPVRIIRGISNVVGDRDASHWRIPSALAAARRLALRALGADEP
jgi:futalosine hydrolase